MFDKNLQVALLYSDQMHLSTAPLYYVQYEILYIEIDIKFYLVHVLNDPLLIT